MKTRTTLSVLLLIGGLGTADPVQHLLSAPAASADAHKAGHDDHAGHDHSKDEHDHAKHDEAAHAGHDHAKDEHDHAKHDEAAHAGHDHAKDDHDHAKHDEAAHAGHDHARGEHDHAKHDDAAHADHDHAKDEHDHAKHAEDAHSGHDHAEDKQDHSKHGDDKHSGHDHDEGGPIRLTPSVMQEFGIEVRVAGGGKIARTVRLPGEVVYNADRIAHVRPAVAGSVQQVDVSVGDRVEAGQRMAVINSRELAVARSEYLAASAKLELARENLVRDRRLFTEKIGTERAVLASRQAFREADIVRGQAENTLHALGYAHQDIAQLIKLEDTAFNTYEMLAPLSGIVTQRHITIGEFIGLNDDDAPFVVADLSSVWINLSVYQRDLTQVRRGMPVTIEFAGDIPDARGTVAFVSPALDETTRTATARVVLENERGDVRPGLFVSGLVETDQEPTAVVVPKSAVTELDGKTVVFVKTSEGFEPREIRRGWATSQAVEIIDGLAKGERYASNNVLALKAETNRAALEHAGHVH